MSIPFRGRSAFLAVASALLALAACREGSGPPQVSRVTVAPDSLDLNINSTVALQVLALDGSGTSIGGKTPTFKTEDPSIATVSASGIVIGVGLGKTHIVATVSGKSAKTTVRVVKVAIARVIMDPPNATTIDVKQAIDIRAQPQDGAGNDLNERTCGFTSSNPAVASVASTSGQTAKVTGLAIGQVAITANCESVLASVQVNVLPEFKTAKVLITPSGPQVLRTGNTLQLTGTAYDAQNNVIPNRPQTWTSSNPLIATVDVNTGKVTAIAPGTATVQVTVDNVSAPATSVLVTLIPLKSVTVAPDSFAIFETSSKQLTLTGIDSAGTLVTDFSQRTLNVLRSEDQTIATVNSGLVVSGAAPGKARIFITVSTPGANEQVSTQSLADIRRINTDAVVINAININAAVGQTVGIQAFAQDSLGRNLQNRPITWTTSDSKIFTVQSQGTNAGAVTGVTAGTAILTATNEGKSSTATVTVK
jgi:uncharacterized protein YjdB